MQGIDHAIWFWNKLRNRTELKEQFLATRDNNTDAQNVYGTLFHATGTIRYNLVPRNFLDILTFSKKRIIMSFSAPLT